MSSLITQTVTGPHDFSARSLPKGTAFQAAVQSLRGARTCSQALVGSATACLGCAGSRSRPSTSAGGARRAPVRARYNNLESMEQGCLRMQSPHIVWPAPENMWPVITWDERRVREEERLVPVGDAELQRLDVVGGRRQHPAWGSVVLSVQKKRYRMC